MLKSEFLKLDEVYIPVARRKALEPDKVEEIAESILEDGQKVPIQVRRGKGRFVVVNGAHRVEAVKMLGEETIEAFIVREGKF
jgi:ParB/RepB/Spo0J family partition protein